MIQARVQGGAQGAWAPPLEIEKQKKKKKKKKKKVIRASMSWAPPPEKLKSKKKKKKKKKKNAFRFWAPPLMNSWTRVCDQWCSGGGATVERSLQFLFSRVERRSSSCFTCFLSILLIFFRNYHLT